MKLINDLQAAPLAGADKSRTIEELLHIAQRKAATAPVAQPDDQRCKRCSGTGWYTPKGETRVRRCQLQRCLEQRRAQRKNERPAYADKPSKEDVF